jgi:hypothetical protein
LTLKRAGLFQHLSTILQTQEQRAFTKVSIGGGCYFQRIHFGIDADAFGIC